MNKISLPVVAKATSRTFDQTMRHTPVIGKRVKKLPFSPTVGVLGLLALGFVTGGLWTASKALVLGGVAFHTWFLNKNTKNDKVKKTAICGGLLAAFIYF
jgi:hypothetical protein